MLYEAIVKQHSTQYRDTIGLDFRKMGLEKPMSSNYGTIFLEGWTHENFVVAAGGIYTGKDIAEFIKLGAAGVQMATRFVATDECDAHINFKKAYINAQDDTIKIVVSPLGMPGRAIDNNHVKTVEATGKKITKCFGCLKQCNPATAPYCITEALVKAVDGDVDDGLVFIGSTGYLVDKIVPVQELMDELTSEAETNL
jgi:NAD(P)H-dependent flavin oxidoreductase YrpB (nitropropane dioxygenase family)